MRGRILCVGFCLALATAICAGIATCYSPPKPACGFVCGPGGACPEDYTCQANRCRLNGATDACAPLDAAAIPDTPMHSGDAQDDAKIADAAIDADSTPPALTSSTPMNGDTNVATSTTITVVFSEPVKNVGTTSFSLSSGVTGTVAAMGGGSVDTTWIFTPSAALANATQYTVTLTSAITDAAGNPFAGTTFTFTTS